MLHNSILTTMVPVLSVMIVAGILLVGPLSISQQAVATTTLTEAERDIIDTQNSAIEYLDESDRDVNGIEYKIRWGAVTTIDPNTIDVLFAECREDEFAHSYIFVFETSDLIPSQSFPVALPGGFMTWVTVVENTDTNDARAASIGVVCSDENDGDDRRDINIDITTKNTIQNIIKQTIRVENNNIINLNNVINVYQQVTQTAYNILSVTGNNNTVNSVITQSAPQIVNQNTTAPTQIEQILIQNAQQTGAITEGQANTIEQTISQEATQQAEVGGEAGPSAVEQALGQNATQQATIEGGSQNDTQTADVDGGTPNPIEQLLGQSASQTTQLTDGP
ncbi:MAG TPA: hypothetical protein VHF28_06925 [Nitrososphaera sp.]|nr:hypothetical protein [Nitrososphaera sp.]